MVRVASFISNDPKQSKPHICDVPGIMEALVNTQKFDLSVSIDRIPALKHAVGTTGMWCKIQLTLSPCLIRTLYSLSPELEGVHIRHVLRKALYEYSR